MNITEGYLEIIVGPMFSGKTTHIIQLYKKMSAEGKKVSVINYLDDTIYHASMLSTHDKVMIPCIQTKNIRDVWDTNLDLTSSWSMTDKEMNTAPEGFSGLKSADIILINEGQFFQDLQECVLEMVNVYKKHVSICGLDGDFQQQKFGQLLDLIPHCNRIEKLTTYCSVCKTGVAIFSKRLSPEKEQLVIGSENYIPVCRKCRAL